MYMKKIMTLVAACIALTTGLMAGGDLTPAVVEPAPIQAKTGFYVAGAVTGDTLYLDGEKSYFNDSDESDFEVGLEARLGYKFYENGKFSTAVEGETGRSFGAEQAGLDYTYYYGAYLVPEYKVAKNCSVYGRVGYAYDGVEFDSGKDIDSDGFAYGIGTRYAFNDTLSVFVDYTMLPDYKVFDQTVNYDKFALGLQYNF